LLSTSMCFHHSTDPHPAIHSSRSREVASLLVTDLPTEGRHLLVLAFEDACPQLRVAPLRLPGCAREVGDFGLIPFYLLQNLFFGFETRLGPRAELES
jgi:hypothetical protein